MKTINNVIRNSFFKVVAGCLLFSNLVVLSACSSSLNANVESEEAISQTAETTSEESTSESSQVPYLKIRKETCKDKNGNLMYGIEEEFDGYGNIIRTIQTDNNNLNYETTSIYEYNDDKTIAKAENYVNGKLINQEVYQYNEKGNVIKKSIFNYDNLNKELILFSTTKYIYDNNHLIKTITNDPQDSIITYSEYEYDEKGKLISDKSYDNLEGNGLECSSESKYEYDSYGNKIKYINVYGSSSYVFTYEYDSKNRVTKGFNETIGYEFEYEYDDKDNVIKQTTYDQDRNLDSITEYEYTYG